MKVVIIGYNSGNIHSVRLALQRLNVEATVSSDPAVIQAADKVIFPGVGEASSAMKFIKANGIFEILPQLRQPTLGICLGLQLMCRDSEENATQCFGIFDVAVRKFPPLAKVPQVGWNTLFDLKGELFRDVAENSYVYFVHSYYAELSEHTIAQTEYIVPYSAAMQKDNFFAVQFHPEKSGKVGEQILQNFIKL
ncbi:MAG TPA: imidazole glycerol phosphate synthase subunit HisH [Candidatus Marinimicrobia bacterium]|nr:imidazole glycerol phosphate synthase subunit HisH [Candidatus Neomarinimicrobiota bacterium]HRS52468.1 imidazole glycerol phosphate synthase subunit HisH [Candidatus Neomarinimicrobiota bacterium]HRU92419.1 imidazole glycerol phosphate synthase subunit HisH [Candidatus Neomarinimicrobiota bacterium]